MNLYTIYNSEGRIIRSGNGVAVTKTGEAVLSGVSGSPKTQRVVDGALVDRDINAASLDVTEIDADGVDTATISGIPNPSTVTVTGPIESEQTVTDGTLEVTTNTTGEYKIKISSFPYQDATLALFAV